MADWIIYTLAVIGAIVVVAVLSWPLFYVGSIVLGLLLELLDSLGLGLKWGDDYRRMLDLCEFYGLTFSRAAIGVMVVSRNRQCARRERKSCQRKRGERERQARDALRQISEYAHGVAGNPDCFAPDDVAEEVLQMVAGGLGGTDA